MKPTTVVSRPIQPLPVERVGRTFQRFAQIEGSSGILLLVATLLALVWANSQWAPTYFAILNRELSFGFSGTSFYASAPLLFWINDGLMAIFFFVVGLEIKRELLIGELSSPRKALLPILAAAGGMLAPAIIFLSINAGRTSQEGWGIPMATDIAFALGVVSLLGKRVPVSLKIFLTALAIVDDLGAVVVIAIFYSTNLQWIMLLVGFALVGLLFAYARLGGRNLLVYAGVGVLVWLAFLNSGVHATVAGVLVAMTVPVRNHINTSNFVAWGRSLLDWFERSGDANEQSRLTAEQRAAVSELETACHHVDSPLQRMESILHPWVAYLIMPIFAWANAGVVISGRLFEVLKQPLALGIILGLLLGKFVGVAGVTLLASRLGLGALPVTVTRRHVIGIGLVAGMGFTMSMFIANLAFDPDVAAHAGLVGNTAKLAAPTLVNASENVYLDTAKIAILFASFVAGVSSFLFLRRGAVVSEQEEVMTPLMAEPDLD